ncbi:MAG: PadR family transcriptional regulator [Candidatus Hermodarchaeota archaeon]
MVENIANKFERTMKKGFVNIFVLMVLKSEPTHGYQIKKLIEQRTMGFWAPTDSTMYTILKDLKDKNLIKLSANQDPQESKKIYELTEKGMEILDLMIQKEAEMRESMRSIISLVTDEEDNDFPKLDEFLQNSPPKMPFMKGPMGGIRLPQMIKNFPIGDIVDKFSKNELKSMRESIIHFLEVIDNKIRELESESDTKSK